MLTEIIYSRAGIIAIILIFIIVPLPSIFAKLRGHPNKKEIYVLNIFLIWTNLGWFILLAWAISGKESKHLTKLRARLQGK